MSTADPVLESAIMETLRLAGEPVREAVLFERVLGSGHATEPEAFLAEVARLETLGHLHVTFDHETPPHDPEPFEPRYLRVIQ